MLISFCFVLLRKLNFAQHSTEAHYLCMVSISV